MSGYDDRLELAPRDIVARAIQDQMLSAGAPHVWLDISHKPRGEVLSHFPNIAARCKQQSIDITQVRGAAIAVCCSLLAAGPCCVDRGLDCKHRFAATGLGCNPPM